MVGVSARFEPWSAGTATFVSSSPVKRVPALAWRLIQLAANKMQSFSGLINIFNLPFTPNFCFEKRYGHPHASELMVLEYSRICYCTIMGACVFMENSANYMVLTLGAGFLHFFWIRGISWGLFFVYVCFGRGDGRDWWGV